MHRTSAVMLEVRANAKLIYRALLELRMEIREIKEQLRNGVARPDHVEQDGREYYIVEEPEVDEGIKEVQC
ncbi:MAG: hypothetical protein R2832_14940 [Rhodothermales bacterium]